VVRAVVLPTAEMAEDEQGGRYYVAFLAALGDHPEVISTLATAYDAYTERFWRLLVEVTPGLPDRARHLRWSIAKDLVNRLFGYPTGQIHQWLEQHCPGADADLVDSLTDIIVGVFRAPVTKPPAAKAGTKPPAGKAGSKPPPRRSPTPKTRSPASPHRPAT
jgi:hypothetical protein